MCVHKADNQYGTFLGFEPITFVPIATSPVVPGVLTRDELDWLNAYHREVFTKLAPHLTEKSATGWPRSAPPSGLDPFRPRFRVSSSPVGERLNSRKKAGDRRVHSPFCGYCLWARQYAFASSMAF